MTDTIGRVEFIVGLDGKRLSAEARKAGKQLAKAGDDVGEDFGQGFDKGFEHEVDASLNKAMQRWQKKWSKEGKLAGKTYAGNIKEESQRIFRKMEKDTIKALSSKEGFKNFAKNFDDVDAAVKQLTVNVRRLSKEKVSIIDPKTGEEVEKLRSFFGNFELTGAMGEIDKWAKKLKESEKATREYRDANEQLKINFLALRSSIDNVSFDRLAKDMGGAEEASKRLRTKMVDLAEAGGVTEREFVAFNLTLERQVERYNAVIKKQQDKIDADNKAKVALAELTEQNEALDRAMLSIENKMGDSKTFARYVDKVGSASKANKKLTKEIDNLGTSFDVSDRKTGKLRRTLANLVDGIQNAGGAAAEATSGGFSKLTELIKKWGANKGGMSIGGIVLLIGSLGAAIGALGSAASAALVGLISSLGVAIVGLGAAAGAAGVGLIWTFMKAKDAIGMMAEEFPRAQAAMDELKAAAKADSAEFARQWGGALADFSSKLAQLWRDDKMGEMAGKALAKVTEAFTAVISSPAYTAFQTAMETTIPNSIANLGEGAASMVEGLLTIFAAVGPMLEEISAAFNQWAEDWQQSIQTAASNGELAAFFELAKDSIQSLMDMLLSLGGLLGTVFTAGAPAGNEMLDMLTDLFSSLDAFLKLPEGQKQLQEWFDNGVKLFDILLDLIGQIGGQFADMITPEIMADTLSALSNLGDGLQVIFDLFQILGGIDVFGNIVAAFEALSAFVTPLVDPLYQITDAIGNLLLAAFEALIPILAAAGEVFAPIVQAIADIVTVVAGALIPVFEALTPALVAIIDAFTPLATLIADVVMKAFNILWPIIQIVIDFIVDLIEAITPLIEEILPVVAALVEQLTEVLDFLWPVISVVAAILGGILKVAFTIIIEVIKLVIQIIVALVEHFTKIVNAVNDKLRPVLDSFADFMDDIWKGIKDSVKTAIDQIVGFFDAIKRVVDKAIGWFNSLFGAANNAKGAADGASKSAAKSQAAFGASGMLLAFPPRPVASGATVAPQAAPFSTGSDPSVQALSTARSPLDRSGISINGNGRGARIVNIEQGAIVVQGNMAPEATATMTVNRIAERVAG